MTKKSKIKEEELPKNKEGITIQMNLNSIDAGIVRDALISAGHVKVADDFETRRELNIMHQFLDSRKNKEPLVEKWSKGTYFNNVKASRYKMKHKIKA